MQDNDRTRVEESDAMLGEPLVSSNAISLNGGQESTLRGLAMNSQDDFEEFCAMLSVVLDIARSSGMITIGSDPSSVEVRCLMFALKERLVQVTSTRIRSGSKCLQTVSVSLTPRGLSVRWGCNGELTLLECSGYGARSRNEISGPVPAFGIDAGK